jgi:tetratricopeptide (TPR) repeat protein
MKMAKDKNKVGVGLQLVLAGLVVLTPLSTLASVQLSDAEKEALLKDPINQLAFIYNDGSSVEQLEELVSNLIAALPEQGKDRDRLKNGLEIFLRNLSNGDFSWESSALAPREDMLSLEKLRIGLGKAAPAEAAPAAARASDDDASLERVTEVSKRESDVSEAQNASLDQSYKNLASLNRELAKYRDQEDSRHLDQDLSALIARTLGEIAKLHRNRGNFAKARLDFEAALYRLRELPGQQGGSEAQLDTLIMLAEVANTLNDHESALAYCDKSLEMIRDLKIVDPTFTVRAMTHKGSALSGLFRYEKAEETFAEVLELQQALSKMKPDLHLARAYFNLAFVQEQLSSNDLAEVNYRQTLAIYAHLSSNAIKSLEEAPTLLAIANFYLVRLKEFSEAKKLFAQVCAIFEERHAEDSLEYAEALCGFGNMLLKDGEFDAGIECQKRGLEMFGRVLGGKDCIKLVGSLQACSGYLGASGRDPALAKRMRDQANEMMQRLSSANDEIKDGTLTRALPEDNRRAISLYNDRAGSVVAGGDRNGDDDDNRSMMSARTVGTTYPAEAHINDSLSEVGSESEADEVDVVCQYAGK